MHGIQEYFNETHRKQAAREERLGKQPCLLLAGPICPLHLEQHEKKKELIHQIVHSYTERRTVTSIRELCLSRAEVTA